MASAAISSPVRKADPEHHPELRLVGVSWRVHLGRAVLFSLPFLVVALYTAHFGFLTNAHAHIAAKALLAADRLRLEVIGFLYPPLPFLLVLIYPRPWMPSLLSSVAAGATAWLLWYDLERIGLARLWRMLLLVALVVVPSSLFLATQAYPDMLALHLLAVAWHYYWNFVRYRHTFSGFMAGLVLGLAFYANFYALLFAIAFALSVPLFRRRDVADSESAASGATLSQMLVTAFPALWAVLSWSYINWIFTGNPFTYFTDPAAAVIDPQRWSVPLRDRLPWLREFGLELLGQPLLVASAVVNARYDPRRLAPFFVLVLVPAVVRFLGLAFSLPLVVAAYMLLAVFALPERLSRWWGPVLVILAVLQGVSSASLVRQAGEVRSWEQVVTTGQSRPSDRQEQELADLLRAAPARAILTDDRSAYRIIARAATARPFLLPADTAFAAALDDPGRAVQYILVNSAPPGRDLVSERFGTEPPDGFVVDGHLSTWTLYRRVDAPSLFARS